MGLLIDPVVFLIQVSAWQKSVNRKWFVLAVCQFLKRHFGGAGPKYFTWFIGAGGRGSSCSLQSFFKFLSCTSQVCVLLCFIEPMAQRRGWELRKKGQKKHSWYSAQGPGRMAQTPQSGTGDSVSRFRCSRCSTLFNYNSYFLVGGQFCFQLLFTT